MKLLLPFVLLLTTGTTTPNIANNHTRVFMPVDTSGTRKTPNPIPLKKDTTLVLWYNAISCPCAQWTAYSEGFPDSTTQFYYLEPANKKLTVADDLWDGNSLPLAIKVTGQITSYYGKPKEYPTKVIPEPANVFRYTKIEVVKKGKPINAKKP
jgi:hypothetical protein